MHEQDRDKLVEAVTYVGDELHELHKAFTAGVTALINNKSILERIEKMENRLMAKISETSAAVNAAFDKIEASTTRVEQTLGALTQSHAGVADDVAYLKETIDKLQTNPGPISPEDQALLDGLQARADGLTAKVEAQEKTTKDAAEALEALNAATVRPETPPQP